MSDSAQHPDASSPADLWGDWKPTAPPEAPDDWICGFCAAENPACYPVACSFCHIRRDA